MEIRAAKAIGAEYMNDGSSDLLARLKEEILTAESAIEPESQHLVDEWQNIKTIYSQN